MHGECVFGVALLFYHGISAHVDFSLSAIGEVDLVGKVFRVADVIDEESSSDGHIACRRL